MNSDQRLTLSHAHYACVYLVSPPNSVLLQLPCIFALLHNWHWQRWRAFGSTEERDSVGLSPHNVLDDAPSLALAQEWVGSRELQSSVLDSVCASYCSATLHGCGTGHVRKGGNDRHNIEGKLLVEGGNPTQLTSALAYCDQLLPDCYHHQGRVSNGYHITGYPYTGSALCGLPLCREVCSSVSDHLIPLRSMLL